MDLWAKQLCRHYRLAIHLYRVLACRSVFNLPLQQWKTFIFPPTGDWGMCLSRHGGKPRSSWMLTVQWVLDSCYNTDLLSVVLQYCNGGDLAEYLHGEFSTVSPRSELCPWHLCSDCSDVCGERGGVHTGLWFSAQFLLPTLPNT